MNLQLIPSSDPVLHKPALPWDWNVPYYDPIELAQSMIDLMKQKRGMGLAAPQVGIPARMFVIELKLITQDQPDIIACFNPRISYQSEETMLLVEGCLSYPNLWLKVKRPRDVRLVYQDRYGQSQTKLLGGYAARCALHELDHLDGVVFTDRAHKFHLDQAMKTKKRLDRQNKEFRL